MDTDNMTLSQVLDALGWRHEKHADSNRQGRDVFDADGNHLGVLDVSDCWAKLRHLDLIA
jgi:hypothetical protein